MSSPVGAVSVAPAVAPAEEKFYQVKEGKLFVGGRACVVRYNSEIVKDVQVLERIASVFMATLAPTTIENNEVWQVSAKGVQVINRVDDKVPAKAITFVANGEATYTSQFSEIMKRLAEIAEENAKAANKPKPPVSFTVAAE
ncbi:MAG: hypothetical protein LLF94_02230 [Chlamydiales bacterium]|nr:hypothetical protein [Chlamydiales bacterium]